MAFRNDLHDNPEFQAASERAAEFLRKQRKAKTSGFSCQECGKKFRTLKAAERASSVGCPKCGGVDVDLD